MLDSLRERGQGKAFEWLMLKLLNIKFPDKDFGSGSRLYAQSFTVSFYGELD